MKVKNIFHRANQYSQNNNKNINICLIDLQSNEPFSFIRYCLINKIRDESALNANISKKF